MVLTKMVVFSHQINTTICKIYNIDVQKELSSPILDSVVRKSNLFLWETFWRFSPRFIDQQRTPILLLLLNKQSFHQWEFVWAMQAISRVSNLSYHFVGWLTQQGEKTTMPEVTDFTRHTKICLTTMVPFAI